jgi:hypothetical protein
VAQWKVLGVVVDGQEIDIDGINPWEHQWCQISTERVQLQNPAYPARQNPVEVSIYKIEDAGRKVTFAAGEVSNCVWCFYVPK